VTRYQDEVVNQQIPYQVCRVEQVEETRDVNVTVQKPVVERITYQVPIRKVRWEEEEQVRQVPYEVRRVEYEEHVEETPVRVCRYVTETSAVQVPRTVGKWVAYQTMRQVPRTVTMRVPLNGSYDGIIYQGPVTSFEAPLHLPPAGTTRRRIEMKKAVPQPPKPEPDPLTEAEKPSEESGDKPAKEPADTKPSLKDDEKAGDQEPAAAQEKAGQEKAGPDLGKAAARSNSTAGLR
jgi:hypothetical protein